MKHRHHYVSRFLLRGFATEGRFTVVPLDGSPVHPGDPKSVGWRWDSHQADPVESDADAFEDAQGALESEAAIAVHRLVAGDDEVLAGDSREVLERLIILHFMRHPDMMAFVHQGTLEQFEGLEHFTGLGGVRRAMLAQAVTFTADPESQFLPQHRDSVMERWATYRAALADFTWNVIRYDKPSLVFGDTLVCLSRLAPRRTRDERQFGRTIGLEAAERITIPLSPTTGLLLSRGDRVRRLIAESFNQSTIGCATEFVLFPPGWPTQSRELFSNAETLLLKRGAAAFPA